MKRFSLSIFIVMLFFASKAELVFANEDCVSISKTHVKVEAWLSKKYEKDYWGIRDEFREIGNTKVGLYLSR